MSCKLGGIPDGVRVLALIGFSKFVEFLGIIKGLSSQYWLLNHFVEDGSRGKGGSGRSSEVRSWVAWTDRHDRPVHVHVFGTTPVVVVSIAVANLPDELNRQSVSINHVVGGPLDSFLDVLQLSAVIVALKEANRSPCEIGCHRSRRETKLQEVSSIIVSALRIITEIAVTTPFNTFVSWEVSGPLGLVEEHGLVQNLAIVILAGWALTRASWPKVDRAIIADTAGHLAFLLTDVLFAFIFVATFGAAVGLLVLTRRRRRLSGFLGGGLGGCLGCWLLASTTSDLVDNGGVGITPAATHLGAVSHAGLVALTVANLLAIDVVHAAALVAPDKAVVVIATF